MKTDNKGFIQAIIILIIILVIASFYGFGPNVIWSNYIAPIFSFIWGVIVAIVNFIVLIIQKAMGAFGLLTSFVGGGNN